VGEARDLTANLKNKVRNSKKSKKNGKPERDRRSNCKTELENLSDQKRSRHGREKVSLKIKRDQNLLQAEKSATTFRLSKGEKNRRWEYRERRFLRPGP